MSRSNGRSSVGLFFQQHGAAAFFSMACPAHDARRSAGGAGGEMTRPGAGSPRTARQATALRARGRWASLTRLGGVRYLCPNRAIIVRAKREGTTMDIVISIVCLFLLMVCAHYTQRTVQEIRKTNELLTTLCAKIVVEER